MIITISREFGSGGRELGKRLGKALDIPCYDNETIQLISERHGYDENYVARIAESSVQVVYPLTIGRRFSMSPNPMINQAAKMTSEQCKIIKNYAAQGDCIIVGRCADIFLKDHRPFRIFVYADTASKLQRCIARAVDGEKMSPAEIERNMKEIDRNRTKYRDYFTNIRWGAREGYDLCINTSGKEIKALIPPLAQYIRCWFEQK